MIVAFISETPGSCPLSDYAIVYEEEGSNTTSPDWLNTKLGQNGVWSPDLRFNSIEVSTEGTVQKVV